jgi:sugar lactone lactonase YvrE
MRAELYEKRGADLGEGPQLFPDGSLRWVDLLRGEIYRKSAGPSALERSYPYEISKVLPWEGGELALTRYGIEAVDRTHTPVFTVPLIASHERGRCSDGTVLPDGSIALGIVDRELRPGRGSLVSVGTDCQVRVITRGCTIPNGIASLASGESVIWTDSATQMLTLLEWSESTGLHSPRPLVHIPDSVGTPDGLVADSSGGAWVAMWGGGAVLHVSKEGDIDETIEVGTPFPTALTFDADDNLIITTGAIVFREQSLPVPPGAGDLWIVAARDHGTRGLPPVNSLVSPPYGTSLNSLTTIPSGLSTNYSERREEDS